MVGQLANFGSKVRRRETDQALGGGQILRSPGDILADCQIVNFKTPATNEAGIFPADEDHTLAPAIRQYGRFRAHAMRVIAEGRSNGESSLIVESMALWPARQIRG
jgi:hypothetical protein